MGSSLSNNVLHPAALHTKGSPNNTVSVLGQEEGYTVKYTPLPKGVAEGKALGNS